jgi:hypothetical protein
MIFIKFLATLIIVGSFGFGVFLFYRGIVPYKVMEKFTGNIQSTEIVKVHGTKSPSYQLVIKINSLHYRLGVHYSSESQAYKSKLIDSLKIDSLYAFYVNPTYPISNGLNSGVSKIESSDKIMFEQSESMDLVLGGFLALFGLIGLIFIRKVYKNLGRT